MRRVIPISKALATNPVIWWSLALTTAYFAVASVVPAYYLIEALNAVFLGVCVAVTIVYWPLLKQVMLRDGEYDRVTQMVLGIVVQWSSNMLGRIYSTNLRIVQGSEHLTSNHSIVGYCILLLIVAGYLQATASTFDIGGTKHFRDNRRVILAMIAGGIIGIGSLVLQRTGLGWLFWA